MSISRSETLSLSISRSHAFLLRSGELSAGQNSPEEFRLRLYSVQ